MDLGASWIHGQRGNPLTGLARAAGAGPVQTRHDAVVLLAPDGAEVDLDLRPAGRLLARALDAAAKRDRDMSVMAALDASPEWRAASSETRRLVSYLVNSTVGTGIRQPRAASVGMVRSGDAGI